MTSAAPHYTQMKSKERLWKPLFFDRRFHPLIRINHFLDLLVSKHDERLEKKEKEAEKQNTSGIYHLKNFNGNKTGIKCFIRIFIHNQFKYKSCQFVICIDRKRKMVDFI